MLANSSSPREAHPASHRKGRGGVELQEAGFRRSTRRAPRSRDTDGGSHLARRRPGHERGVALHVLFVCTGNICRSPTAERLATAYSARLNAGNFTASSAGTRAVIAHPIHHEAALILGELGGDASGFAARQLTAKIASDADLVLTMTRAHRDAVLEHAPRQLHRTFTLSEAARLVTDYNARNVADLAALRTQLVAGELVDIPDPIGRSRESFAMVGSQIADLLPPILELCRDD
ncbi:low molecular weight phosphatase family protein [Mycobacterium sp. URHB0044]|uniref:arsenate reductase/protein-tyrosine-phosphatase family protein n=1 Tax=Mycobacterium sp. URHB0044 TaxID=1380386 RepID=UPI0018CC60B4